MAHLLKKTIKIPQIRVKKLDKKGIQEYSLSIVYQQSLNSPREASCPL